MNKEQDELGPLTFGSLGGDGELDEQHLNIAVYKEGRIDSFLRTGSDLLSAILVKETRQSLNSRQFLWTFFGLLFVVVVYALFMISTLFIGRNDGSLGPSLLLGFLSFLAFPLLVVLPFATFRSMAKEFEDGTLQMISITTMKPYQIAAGKLGNALLQMLMYVSIFAPCMAFTSLLEGVSIGQITLSLLLSIGTSLSLCCLGLFFGCRARSGLFAVFGNLLLLAILIGSFASFTGFASVVTLEPRAYQEITGPIGSVIIWGIASLVLSTGALCFVAATSMVAFDTDNRTTPIRVAILVQQMLFFSFVIALAGLTGARNGPNADEVFEIFVPFYGHYWMVFGCLLIASSPIIGNRVRRSFPKTILGRTFGGLLMPGAGRAYLFTVANLIGCGILFWCLVVGWDVVSVGSVGAGNNAVRNLDVGKVSMYITLNTAYPLLFLSMTYLLLALLRHKGVQNISPMFGVLIGVFMTLLLALGGLLIQYWFFYRQFRDSYTVFQCFHWWFTLIEFNRNNGVSGEVVLSLTIASISSVVAFAACLVHAARTTVFVGAATPDRVVQEQKELAAEKVTRSDDEERFEDLFDDGESGSVSTDRES